MGSVTATARVSYLGDERRALKFPPSGNQPLFDPHTERVKRLVLLTLHAEDDSYKAASDNDFLDKTLAVNNIAESWSRFPANQDKIFGHRDQSSAQTYVHHSCPG